MFNLLLAVVVKQVGLVDGMEVKAVAVNRQLNLKIKKEYQKYKKKKKIHITFRMIYANILCQIIVKEVPKNVNFLMKQKNFRVNGFMLLGNVIKLLIVGFHIIY